jgi:Tol biopolymer transport system component
MRIRWRIALVVAIGGASLTESDSGARVAATAVSGDTIAFATAPTYKLRKLFLMATDGTRRRAVPTPREFDQAAWSRDGRRVVLSTQWPRVGMYLANADGSNRHRLRVRHGPFDALTPVWSPDGRMIAFERYDDGCHAIWVMRSDGADLRNLTKRHCGYDQDPSWSPDSKRIAFTSVRRLVVMDADGGHRHVVSRDANAMPEDNFDDKAWLPGAIFFINRTSVDTGERMRDLRWHLVRIAPDGSQLKDLTLDEVRVTGFAVAADHRTIAYSSKAGLFVTDVVGAVPRQLSPNGWDPSWSPNSRRLAFLDVRGADIIDVYAINSDGTEKRNLTQSKVDECCLDWLSRRS